MSDDDWEEFGFRDEDWWIEDEWEDGDEEET